MCGFVAIHDREQALIDEQLLHRMTDALAHRGPDDAGIYRKPGVALGFRRLSILDLSKSGSQPMQSACGRFVIAFNGEIYNYRELRAQLAGLGHDFHSTSDTEVLLAAWKQWGKSCLPRLNGMWAFVIWDNLTRTLVGSRDRFGIKPLYWRACGSTTAFVSEIKAIRDTGFARLDVDSTVLARMVFEDEIEDGVETFYRDVYRVPAGTWFELGPGKSLQFHSFWSLQDAASSVSLASDPSEAFAFLFEDAVRLQMRSDVAVGVLLSGGMDSTSIACAMQQQLPRERRPGDLVALSYISPDFDERALIEETVQRTAATWVKSSMSPEDLWKLLEKHMWHQDEPVQSMTSTVSYQLLATARAQGIKVVLNGQGADEALAGYPHFLADYWSELIRSGRWYELLRSVGARRRIDPEGWRPWLVRAVHDVFNRVQHVVPGVAELGDRRRAARIAAHPLASADLKQSWRPRPYRQAASAAESMRWSVEHLNLPLYLRVEDRNSMAHGVELRVPFLDHRLIALAFALESDLKLKDGHTKAILRDSMKGRIPESVRTRVTKYGFPTSVDQWFRGPLLDPMRDLLGCRSVVESGLWNIPAIRRMLDLHARGAINAGATLFDIAQVSLWMDLARSPFCAPDIGRSSSRLQPASSA